MSSDRDLAQQWLAERIANHRGHGGVWHGDLLDAAAILDTPGVEVGWLLAPLSGETRLSIKLPATVRRSDVAAHQHTEKINEEKP